MLPFRILTTTHLLLEVSSTTRGAYPRGGNLRRSPWGANPGGGNFRRAETRGVVALDADESGLASTSFVGPCLQLES